MNASRKGNRAERELLRELRNRGYRAGQIKRSGQLIADDAKERGIACDIIAFSQAWDEMNDGSFVHDDPHLVIEVGSAGKGIATSFERLRETSADIPGSVPLVARKLPPKGGRARWAFNTSSDDRYDTLDAALAALRNA